MSCSKHIFVLAMLLCISSATFFGQSVSSTPKSPEYAKISIQRRKSSHTSDLRTQIQNAIQILNNAENHSQKQGSEVLPPNLKQLASTNFKEKIVLENYGDMQYYGEIFVGQSRQEFTAIFDTGSSQIWLPASTCTSCSTENKYICSATTCSAELDSIQYGKGSISGNVSKDTFIFGEKEITMPFISVTQADDFNYLMADGLVGLGPQKKDSIVNKLYSEKKITQNLFSIRLTDNDDENQSELILGGYDESIVGSKNVNYFPLATSYYWAVSLKSASIDGNVLFSREKARIALIDSGTSLIHMPSDDYAKLTVEINRLFPNCADIGILVCMCRQTSVAKFPAIKITLVNEYGTQSSIEILSKYFLMFDQGYCYFLLAPIPEAVSSGMWILGDVFMRQTYNIFNYDKKAIGIINLDSSSSDDPSKDSSSIGGFAKFFVVLVMLGLVGFLAKFSYDTYIKQPREQQEEQRRQQQQQLQQNLIQSESHINIPMQDLQPNPYQQVYYPPQAQQNHN